MTTKRVSYLRWYEKELQAWNNMSISPRAG